MKPSKARFFAKYGGPEQIQHVLDNEGVEHYEYNSYGLKNRFITKDQLHYIIRGTESRRVRKEAIDSPVFGHEHIEQMLNDGESSWEERQALAVHPKLTDTQAKRFLDDPHEIDHIKQTVLKFTKSKDILEHGMNHPNLDWSAKLGILRNTNMTKDIHSRLLKDPDGMIRFTAMKHDMSTPEEIQHYIDHEPKDESEDDNFHHAKEHLERKQAHQRILAARAELKANKALKEDVEPELKIDLAKEEDMKAVMNIEKDFPKAPWKKPESFQKPDHRLMVAKLDNDVVGYIYTKHTHNEKDHLVKMMVHKDHRKTGVATEMLKTLTRPTSLNVRESNSSAMALYQKHGFKVAKIIPKMYKDGEDAVHMIKDFK